MTPRVVLAALLFAALGFFACDSSDPAESSKTVNLLIYSEYLDPAIKEAFTKETGYRVEESNFESTEEVLPKLEQAGGVREFDLVVVASQGVPVLSKKGLLAKLDHSKIPNLVNLESRFRDLQADRGNLYSVSYQCGTVGILYDRKKFPDLEPSWGVIFDPARQVGSFVLLDELRDQMGVVLRYLGHSVNSTRIDELKAAGETLLAAKRSDRCLGFLGGVEAKNRVQAGTADLAVVWSGDALRAIEEDDRLAYIVPKEGSVVWVDQIAIPSGAPNAAGAHAFIDFILRPQVGAQLSNFMKFGTPNQAAKEFVDPALARNPAFDPPDTVLERCEYVQDIGAAVRVYTEAWTSVKSR